ncbi:hypothetical protein NSQ96_12315 [Caldifermentibacillus hisashii]|uniref:Uncharacterized protein n=1 Tax=Caldifermentibacillus hisashii TaxID=996558 RepID=A0ABU9JYS3_9BACI
MLVMVAVFFMIAPAMSEEEFREAIIEQAKKDAAKGICGGESAGYRNL